MKWIDQQDDYFLRNFNGDSSSSSSTSSPSDVQAGAGEATLGGSGREFSFDDSSTPGNSDGGPSQSPRRSHRGRNILIWIVVILLLVGAGAFWLRYYVPYTSDTLVTGYITLVEQRGQFFKTYEGEMVAESRISNPDKIVERDFSFSIPNDSLARVIQSYQGTGIRVTVTTQRYHGTLPWRGASDVVATNVREN